MPMLLHDGGEEQAARALCLNRPDDIMFGFAALREPPFTNVHLLCDRTIIVNEKASCSGSLSFCKSVHINYENTPTN